MPIHNRAFQTAECEAAPEQLAVRGALLRVQVGLHEALKKHLHAEGYDVPEPIEGWALIDTGARSTCVDIDAVRALGIAPVGVVSTTTPGGESKMPLFPTCFRFPGLHMEISFHLAVGAGIRGVLVKSSSDHVLMLVGRDILAHSVLVYNGLSSSYTLAY
jgi:hypothetical protein